ncbi:MAG: Gfo/Idh/MocA family oxidoreductase [Desulfobacteraceae bacterium]|nr:Gfo/Idh/MocA family oxidoreductase [Desulfobacteraceae bacterium]
MAKLTTGIGVVGCGNISDAYLKTNSLTDLFDIVACADIDMERAHAKAQKHNISKVCSVAELLNDPDIDLVLNLTPPQAHAEMGLAAIKAGKSLYSEKPLALVREDGHTILAKAKAKKLCIGCAPDTFLGRVLQTCRYIIDDGHIGRPIAATAFMMNHGHESWHPEPEFFYQPGGGPMFDMGPYYITALVTLLGPACQVTGITQTSFQERVITSQPRHGSKIAVNTPTHITGAINFVNGAVATVITSFDTWIPRISEIEIYGAEGTLSLSDPAKYDGSVSIWRHGTDKWEDVPLTDNSYNMNMNGRGIGLTDMVYALQSGQAHQANGELAYHVLDIMCAFYDSSQQKRHIEINSSYERPVQ